MAETEKERRARVIKDVLEERGPNTPLAHAVVFALLSAQEGVTQKEYSEAIGVSDRTIRKYIADNRKEYDEEYSRAEAELTAELGRVKQKQMTGTQLDAFIDVLIDKAISENGSTQDRKLLLEFTGLNGKDLIQRNAQKQTSLHWWILNNLGTVTGFMNTRELGINLTESELVCREDTYDGENLQNFIDRSIFEDTAFMREAMYWGLVFMSLYNRNSHPDLLLMGDLVRLDRLKDYQDLPPEEQEKRAHRGMTGASKYADGKDYRQPGPVSQEELEAILKELNSDTTYELSEERKAEIQARCNAKQAERNRPKIKREDVVNRVTAKESRELLKLYLGADEWLYDLLHPDEIKQY